MFIYVILEGGVIDDIKYLIVYVVFDIGIVFFNLQSKMYFFIDLFMFVKSYFLGGFFFFFYIYVKSKNV